MRTMNDVGDHGIFNLVYSWCPYAITSFSFSPLPCCVLIWAREGLVGEVAPALTCPAQADIAGDAGEPLCASVWVTQFVYVTPCLQQHLLRQILGDVCIACDCGIEPNQPGPFGWQHGL
jgi:hypothetical protein